MENEEIVDLMVTRSLKVFDFEFVFSPLKLVRLMDGFHSLRKSGLIYLLLIKGLGLKSTHSLQFLIYSH